jgi:hypothetical protein
MTVVEDAPLANFGGSGATPMILAILAMTWVKTGGDIASA